ncbi:MAG: hypothetical protein LH481_11095 [Burkholderiales bacterium]|nr:hypothetical protein [Burkholderiales bacterium]
MDAGMELAELPKTDDAFCCLGATIRQAGSQAAFRKVDFDYVVNFATAAKAAGVKRFLFVSAIAANAKSGVFYNRIKGKMENALKAMNFESLHIFRPSFLVGERAEARVGERLGIAVFSALALLMIGPARGRFDRLRRRRWRTPWYWRLAGMCRE